MMMTKKTSASTQWIKKNMLAHYSEELDRPLTEAEVRFRQCTEQLPVPDWYSNYRKPYASKYLKNSTPIESRPPHWKTLASSSSKSISAGSPKKKRSPPKKTPNKTPKKAQQNSEAPRTVSADSGFGDTFCLSPRTPKSNVDATESSFTPCSTSSPALQTFNVSDSEAFETSRTSSPKSSKKDVREKLDGSLNNSNTFPRIAPSRKIENINIVFSKPFPPEQEPLTVEDITKARSESTNEDSIVQGIIEELDRTFSVSSITTPTTREVRSPCVRSMVEALEQSNSNVSGDSNIFRASYYIVNSSSSEEEEEIQSDDSTDSDLANSTSISVKSNDSDDERAATPLYSACIAEVVAGAQEEESGSDEEVYWAPCTLLELPRPSSRLSIASNIFGTQTHGGVLTGSSSMIKHERAEDVAQQMQQATKAWNLAGRSNGRSSSSRQLYRIDETDYGYSAIFISARPTIV